MGMFSLPIIVGIVLVVIAFWLLMTYNSLITLRNRVKEGWSQIDVQLKRRSSLIPNLVETVKGYAKHEKGVFEEVSKARSAMMGTSGIKCRAFSLRVSSRHTSSGALLQLLLSEALISRGARLLRSHQR
jgi:LemA protein